MEVNADIEYLRHAENALWEGEAELPLALDTIPVLAWCQRADGSNEYLNQRWHDYTGLSAEEAQGWGWTVSIHPDDLERLLDVWHALLDARTAGELEARLRRFDGAYQWFLFRAEPLRDRLGNVIKWYGATTDIDDRKKAEAMLTGENQTLELIASGSPLAGILDGICGLLDEFSEDVLVSDLLLDQDGKHLRWGAGSRFPTAFVAAVDGIEPGPCVGSCGTAAFRKEQVIVSDIATDPLWVDYRELALEFGLRAGWSTPIFSSDGSLLGTFALYWKEPRSPTEQHQQIIKQLTHLTAVAIEREHAAEALRASEKLVRGQTEALTQAVEAMARESSPDRIAEHVLRTVVRQLDAHSSGVWLRSDATGLVGFEFAIEDGQFKTKADSIIAAIGPPLGMDEVWPWPEVFRTGQPYVLEDIQTGGDLHGVPT